MTRPTITRTDEVLKVLRKGGRIEQIPGGNCLRLLDRKGEEVPAWQTAIKTAQQRQEASRGQ